jgi:excisionase family DNA binding protein
MTDTADHVKCSNTNLLLHWRIQLRMAAVRARYLGGQDDAPIFVTDWSAFPNFGAKSKPPSRSIIYLRQRHINRMELTLPEFLTIDDVANLLRVSQETVRRMARRGELPFVRGLRVYRFPREAVLTLLYSIEPRGAPR